MEGGLRVVRVEEKEIISTAVHMKYDEGLN